MNRPPYPNGILTDRKLAVDYAAEAARDIVHLLRVVQRCRNEVAQAALLREIDARVRTLHELSEAQWRT